MLLPFDMERRLHFRPTMRTWAPNSMASAPLHMSKECMTCFFERLIITVSTFSAKPKQRTFDANRNESWPRPLFCWLQADSRHEMRWNHTVTSSVWQQAETFDDARRQVFCQLCHAAIRTCRCLSSLRSFAQGEVDASLWFDVQLMHLAETASPSCAEAAMHRGFRISLPRFLT